MKNLSQLGIDAFPPRKQCTVIEADANEEGRGDCKLLSKRHQTIESVQMQQNMLLQAVGSTAAYFSLFAEVANELLQAIYSSHIIKYEHLQQLNFLNTITKIINSKCLGSEICTSNYTLQIICSSSTLMGYEFG